MIIADYKKKLAAELELAAPTNPELSPAVAAMAGTPSGKANACIIERILSPDVSLSDCISDVMAADIFTMFFTQAD